MGGDNSGQLIEYVHSYDPRSWSCLHIAEGSLTCSGATIQNNDIGPCGSDSFQQWADGISLSCSNSLVRNNTISDATDGGIVVFGAPGSLIQNNTISVQNSTCLGGINMVDYEPWLGNYTNTVVRDNIILGGFASGEPDSPTETKGVNKEDAIIKIGIAIGPRTWFGNQYLKNVSSSGTVLSNSLSGAFGYAIAITSAHNFTVENNALFGNTSFIGSRGPNCTTFDTTPTPQPFVVDRNNTDSLSLQSSFVQIPDGDSLTCILPPDGGDYWPFRDNGPSNNSTTSGGGGGSTNSNNHSSGLSGGAKAGIAIGVIAGVALVAIATYFIRKAALKRQLEERGARRLASDEDMWEGKQTAS
jgi:parallel beta-helix repeat protein